MLEKKKIKSDKYCDAACKNEKCGFDAGDCDVDDIKTKLAGYAVSNQVSQWRKIKLEIFVFEILWLF